MSDVNEKPASARSFEVKDLFIPVSIVLAGLIIGAGLYLGGLSGAVAPTGTVVDNSVSNGEKIDKTNLVEPVTEADHIRGSVSAPIKIVEYSDFDCPYCARFHETMKLIIGKYSSDEVAWVYRHFPLNEQSESVSQASECVAELAGNDAFWKFADEYYKLRQAGDRTASAGLISKLSPQVGVPQAKLDTCLNENRHLEIINSHQTNGSETGGQGTPWAILIGPSGKTYPINGAIPLEEIERIINRAKQEA